MIIGYGFGIVIGLLLLIGAETIKGRLFLGSVMAVLFLMPVIWQSRTSSLFSFLGWIVLGIGGLIFFKWRTAGG